MIELTGLTKRYGSTVAVRDLTFSVKPGVVTGFLGPNGAGKSTTMRLILGLDGPDAGQARVNGKVYRDHAAPLAEVGALLEARSLHPGRSAYNHLLALAASNGIGASRVDQVLQIVGLESVAKRRAGTFSLGMSQRLGIAGALLGDPAVLLFDEPVNGLDPEGIRWVRQLMHQLAAEGRTVLVSSHLMSEMALTAQHLIVIGRGKLIADESVEAFVAKSTRRSVLVRSPRATELAELLGRAGAGVQPNGNDSLLVTGLQAPAVGEMAANNNLALHELTPQTGSLEDAFMELTRESVDFGAEMWSQTGGQQ